MLCDYGCETESNFQLKNGKYCCSKKPSGCKVLKEKNSEAQKSNYKNNPGPRYNYNSLDDEKKIRMSGKGQVLLSVGDVFIDGKEWGSELLRKYLHHYKLKEYKCEGLEVPCHITTWHGQDLTLELDHINGIRNDNRLDNLRWLCPNCHSQTPTF